MVRPCHCLMSFTGKQLLRSAIESRCTPSCIPYKMPEEISRWSETRNVMRPLSTYGSNTKRVRRMVSLHPIEEGGMCTAQTATSLRGFSRNNQNKVWADARQMRETTTAKAENKATRAGMHSLAEIDLRVCMLIVKHLRGPHVGTH